MKDAERSATTVEELTHEVRKLEQPKLKTIA